MYVAGLGRRNCRARVAPCRRPIRRKLTKWRNPVSPNAPDPTLPLSNSAADRSGADSQLRALPRPGRWRSRGYVHTKVTKWRVFFPNVSVPTLPPSTMLRVGAALTHSCALFFVPAGSDPSGTCTPNCCARHRSSPTPGKLNAIVTGDMDNGHLPLPRSFSSAHKEPPKCMASMTWHAKQIHLPTHTRACTRVSERRCTHTSSARWNKLQSSPAAKTPISSKNQQTVTLEKKTKI